jgi:EAL domain-containing protein (putative c-di-GMP-specific phosphodiesterase class I)
MIVSLAHTLGLKVIAEGVEDDEQVRLLRDLGCDQIQGYLVSRPVPPQEIEALLRRFALAPGNAAAA